LELAHGHAASVHRNDLVVEAREAAGMLRPEDRPKRPIPFERYRKTQRADVVKDGLARRPIKVIRLALGPRLPLLISDSGGSAPCPWPAR
jgi:hypothetical protein